MTGPVTDPRDTRVLIPRVRRALLGPHATGSAAVGNDLDDSEVNGLVADSIADIILFSGGSDIFGHSLEVAERDPYYMAPSAWRTDTELSEVEGSIVVAQAALNYFLVRAEMLKTSEKIADEGQSWEYGIAASVVTERIAALRDARDRALDTLRDTHLVSDAYVNLLEVRDRHTDALIEPWACGSGGGQETDWRFC